MRDIEKILSKLPDGVFVSDHGVYHIDDGKVVKYVPEGVNGSVSTRIVGGHQDPKEDNS